MSALRLGLGRAWAAVSRPSLLTSPSICARPTALGLGFCRQSRGFLTSFGLLSRPHGAPLPLARRAGLVQGVLTAHPDANGSSPLQGPMADSKRFTTRNIRGRLFYKRRPKMIPIWRFNRKSKWLEGTGFRKGVCTKVYVMAPRKPNSGLRKVTYVRLSNGRIIKAAIPGMGHNLQVHSVVMIRGGHKKDTDGCNYTCMRGKYDLLPVKNRFRARSKYGVTRPANIEPNRKRWKHLVTSVDRRLHFYKTGTELGPDEPVPKRIPFVVRPSAPFTYTHNKKKVKKGK
mmetsp:Transcript_61565/g.156422  ORF Transcript_61565/g.156422 Transcript_61565/m.156422 type:complete len:286 (+) Transcript_61565:70-927(+)